MTHRDLRELQEIVRQWRDAWRDCIAQVNGEAAERENWDGSDHNLQAFDDVMDFVLKSKDQSR